MSDDRSSGEHRPDGTHEPTGPPVGGDDDEDDRHLLEITYEGALASLRRILSPSLADFLA